MTNNSRTTTRRLPVDQLREQAGVIGHDMQELGSIAKDAAHDAITEGRKAAQDVITQGRKRAQGLESSFEAMIKENPVRAVLIAAGVGFLASIIFGRR